MPINQLWSVNSRTGQLVDKKICGTICGVKTSKFMDRKCLRIIFRAII